MGREKKRKRCSRNTSEVTIKNNRHDGRNAEQQVSCPSKRRWIAIILIVVPLPYRETMGYNILLSARLVTKSQAQYVAQLEHKHDASTFVRLIDSVSSD